MFNLLKNSSTLKVAQNSINYQLVRFRSTVQKAPIFYTESLDDGSKFISRVPRSVDPIKIEDLPPAIRKSTPAPKKYHLTKEQVEEMRKLRNEDPHTWTRSKLAKKFDCSLTFVTMQAPAPKWYSDELMEKKTELWNEWGYKRQLIYVNKQRRRAQW
jgi:hypothetical protein